MKLSKRLNAICNFLTCEDIISDIGTDHGLVPIYHLLTKQAQVAYACDINNGPLEQAKKNIDHYKVNCKTILSNGVENITSDTNCLVIAGMGNITIEQILTKNIAKLEHINKIVVQSNTYSYTIRALLTKMGYKIDDETVVYDKGKFYEIDVFKKGNESYSDFEIKYGKYNLLKKELDFIAKLKMDLETKTKIFAITKDSNLAKDISEITLILKQNGEF